MNWPQQREVGVHVLSEYIFCPRAGLLEYEKDNDDDGREDRILRLDYLPNYERWEIERQLNQKLSGIWAYVYAASGFAIVSLLLAWLVHSAFFGGGVVALFLIGRWAWNDLREIFKLYAELKAAHSAIASEPDPNYLGDEPVNWWSLHAAGFSAEPTRSMLLDDELQLQGRPWMILRRGDLSIPAFVRRSADELRPQQRARIAAYCHLIQLSEGAKSPYGVVLDRGTFVGVAVKPSREDQRLVRTSLDDLRAAINESQRPGWMPSPPGSDVICCRCPHGKPRAYVPDDTDSKRHGRPITPYCRPYNGCNMHSHCGDRYGWFPRHEDSLRMGLV